MTEMLELSEKTLELFEKHFLKNMLQRVITNTLETSKKKVLANK